MSRRTCMIILTALIIFLLASETEAANILSIHIEKDEWSWVGDTAATFKGSIICQGVTDEDPVILRLTLITGPDDSDSGEIVFTSVNHKRLAVRKQKNEYTPSIIAVMRAVEMAIPRIVTTVRFLF